MAQAPDTSGLVQRAMQLRAQNPDAWNALVAEMMRYTQQVTKLMISAPPDLILRAQGMALGANELTEILRTAPETYEKMQAAEQRKRGP